MVKYNGKSFKKNISERIYFHSTNAVPVFFLKDMSDVLRNQLIKKLKLSLHNFSDLYFQTCMNKEERCMKIMS